MHYNLIVNYYIDKNKSRTDELNFCMLENINNPTFNNIVIIGSEVHINSLMAICPEQHKSKILPVVLDKRPSFNDYFMLLSKLFNSDDNINIVANLDIMIPKESLLYASFYMPTKKTCLALTRWDITNGSDYKNNAILFDRPDAQDTWIFKGGIPQISGATNSLGNAGIDNSIAYQLEQAGYNVINPSRTLKTFHLHLIEVRNYTNIVGHAIHRIPPPYKLLPPTF
jgi:hypothetical protein